VGAELFHSDKLVDKRTDLIKLKVAFCDFLNTLEIHFLINESLCKSISLSSVDIKTKYQHSLCIYFTHIRDMETADHVSEVIS
jgi:hypothetical protein